MRHLARSTTGSSLVEFVLVIPFVLLVFFATVEFALAMAVWTNATKASHWGARAAVVTDPVARNVQFSGYGGDWGINIGTSCIGSNGLPTTDTSNVALCSSLTVTCQAEAGTAGTCTGGFVFDNDAFALIFERMQRAYGGLRRENVEVEYSTNGLGFVARPNGLPLTVTVRLRCVNHQWMFLQGFVDWPVRMDDCNTAVTGLVFPRITTTMTGESLCAVPALPNSLCATPS